MAFYGTTDNALKSQVCIALSFFVLVAIIKTRLHLEASLYTILQIFSVTLFEKTPLLQVLTDFSDDDGSHESDNQLNLFN